MKSSWMFSLFVGCGLIGATASAQQETTTPISSSPGVSARSPWQGTTAKTEGVVTPAPAPSTIATDHGDWLGGGHGPDAHCDRGGLYGDFDYLYWWFKKGGVPALVTHGDPIDTPTGALGQPGTNLLFGNHGFGSDPFSGIRFTIGYSLDGDGSWGVESTTLFLEQRRSFFSASSTGETGTGTLAIPLFNSDGGFEDANVVGLEGTQAGTINIRLTQRLWGTEANLRLNGAAGDNFRIAGLVGFRFLDLQESLDLDTFAAALPTSTGITTALAESYATRNRFYGGQIGAQADYTSGKVCLTALAKVALGGNDEQVKINGTTVNVDPIAGTVVSPGGLFSGPSNIGDHNHCRFAVVPEVGINVGYRFSDNLCATVGYTFLYLSDVVRPGDQIDRSVSFQANGRPMVLLRQSDFWAQGINVGLQYRY
jgi:hypothetical protein